MTIYIVKCTYGSDDQTFQPSELSYSELIDRIFERAEQLKDRILPKKETTLPKHIVSFKRKKRYAEFDEWRVDMYATNPHVTYIPFSRRLHHKPGTK